MTHVTLFNTLLPSNFYDKCQSDNTDSWKRSWTTSDWSTRFCSGSFLTVCITILAFVTKVARRECVEKALHAWIYNVLKGKVDCQCRETWDTERVSRSLDYTHTFQLLKTSNHEISKINLEKPWDSGSKQWEYLPAEDNAGALLSGGRVKRDCNIPIY